MGALPLDESPVADWSSHLFLAGRTPYVLLSNTRSLYSTLLLGKGITTERHYTERALSGIRELLAANGQEGAYRRFIAAAASVRFAKALDRSVTGSMNDLMRNAAAWLAEGALSPHDVGARLNDTLLSALARSKSAPYGKPRDAFKELVLSIEAGAE